MAVTPDLDLSIVVRARSADGLGRTLASLDAIPRVDRGRVEVVVVGDVGDAEALASLEGQSFGGVEAVAAAGASAAAMWNRGLKHGRGVWVMRLEAGDELLCNPLPYLDRHPAATCVQFAVRLVKGRGKRLLRPRKLTERNCLRWLTAGNPVRVQGMVFRKVFATHPFDETLEHLQEWAFWLLNRGVFDRPALEKKVAAAATPNPGDDFNRAAAAPERARIAERMVNRLRFRLPRSQRNNLHLQRACGLRQQGKGAPFFKTLVSVPSDSALYVRGLMSLLFGRAAARR